MADHLPTGTVTFLFTDIEGSTRLVQRLGEGWVAVLEDHDAVVRDAIESNGGIVVKTEGDAFFAVFTSARDATLAAVAVQGGLADHHWPEEGTVRVRIGMHTGSGLLGGADYVGLDVHRAARIADTGHGGQVVMSETTAVLVERELPEGTRLKDLGKHRLKDLSEPETIFQVCAQGLRSEFPLLRTLDAIPNNLPKQLTSFVGRDRELAEAMRLLDSTRLLTLTGPGGTGKTRLSLQLAAETSGEFSDGVFFVDLAPVTDPDLVPSRILEALGLSTSTRDETPSERLMQQLADKSVLLLLDNFEQLLDAAPTVAELLRSSPHSKVLVTSRAPLRITGEQEMPVPPLEVASGSGNLDDAMGSEAVRLFADRAAAVRPGFQVTSQNAGAVVELVRRLDGLPLALELVASRVRLFPVDQILSRLDTRMLGSGSIDLPERQRTIENAIAWSHDLLEEPERRLFSRFSVFAGGARLEEVEEICGPSEELGNDLINCLSVLVDHSLIRRVDTEGLLRFRMLHVIREYAATRLQQSAEEEEMRRRHATAYTGFAEEVAPLLLGHERRHWLDVFEDDHDNIRAALDWAGSEEETDIALRLAAASWRFWQARGHLFEARRRIEAALDLPGGEPRHRAKAMEALGGVLWWQSDMEECRRVYEETLALQRQLGDPKEVANALYNTTLVHVFGPDEGDDAFDLIDEAERIYAELGDTGGLGDVHWGRGNIEAYLNEDFAAGREHMKQAIEYYRKAGNEFGMGWALFEVADMSRRLGDLDEARRFIVPGLELFAHHRDVSAVVLFIAQAAGLALIDGDLERARRLGGVFHTLRIQSGTDIVINEVNRVDGLEFETLEALTGEEATPYLEGRAMGFDEGVAYALAGHPGR